MPRTPDASMVTTFRRVNATVTADPEKKSATFLAPTKAGYLSSVLRSTQEAQSIVSGQSVLSLPTYRSPRFNGRFFVI